MRTRFQKHLLFLATWCTAALALVGTVNLSCGTVPIKPACAQSCPELEMLEMRLAELETRATLPSGGGVVGIGSIVAHTTHLPGSATIDQMRAAGFAVCDGTTPESQGITAAVLTGATPDLNGRFLRGRANSGELQDDATAANGLVAVVNQTAHTHSQPAHTHAASGGAHDHGLNAHTHGMDHTHVSRVADSNGFCNPGAVPNSQGHLANQTDWTRSTGTGCHYTTTPARLVSAPLSARSSTDASTGNTATTTPVISIGSTAATNDAAMANIAVAFTGGDSETRPANMSVVWMIRVR